MKGFALMLVTAAALVVAAPATATPLRPDDRAKRGIAGDPQQPVVRPDDRGYRLVIEQPSALVRPDDRGYRLVVEQPKAVVRPDDRAGFRGIEAPVEGPIAAPAPATDVGGVDWRDLTLGLLLGMGAVLAAFIAARFARHRVHLPQRAAHGH